MTAMTRTRDAMRSRQIGTDPGQDWRLRAACRDEDPDLFHIDATEGSRGYAVQVAAAKAIFRRCPVTADCLAFAEKIGDNFAIAGGLTARERRTGRLRQSRTVIRTCAWCGRGFATRRARYCKPACREQAARAEKSRARQEVTL